MAKAVKEECALCGAKIPVVSFCPRCGQPTRHVSAGERVMWELGQWQSSRSGGAPVVQAPPDPPPSPAAAPPASRPRSSRRRSPEEVAARTERNGVVHKLRRRDGSPSPAAPVRPAASVAPVPAIKAPAQEPRRSAASVAVATKPAPRRPEKAAPAPAPERDQPKSDTRFELRPGETILAEVRGVSHLRRAKLVVTTLRVAMIRFPRVAWIPLEHIDSISVQALGKGLRLQSTIEVLSVYGKRSAVREAREVIERVVEASKRPGVRHDSVLVQEWCDRSGEMWDSHTGQLRLFARRHPIASFTVAGGIVALAKIFGP